MTERRQQGHHGARWLAVLGVTAAVLLAAHPAGAVEQFPAGPNHRGVVEFEPYRVFPENRLGNAVYLDNVLVFETRDRILMDVQPTPVDGRFVYYARSGQGAPTLGISVKPADGTPRVENIAPGFFHVTMQLGGVWYKKLYRIVDHKILDLLSASKTADGATAGPGGVVFFHVASAIRAGEEGQTEDGFGLRLHLALPNDERPRHLNFLVVNTRPSISFKWLDESRIEVGLSEGRTQIISVSQFQ